MKRWLHRPEGSNWGDFGEDDQIGRMNLITPERRLAAVREVREGIAFVLGLPLDLPSSEVQRSFRKPPKVFSSMGHNSLLCEFFDLPGIPDIGNDDGVTLYTQYSTQWDALSHMGALFDSNGDGVQERCYYNGYLADQDIVNEDEKGNSNARRLGVDSLAATGVQGRGVLLNLFSIYGNRHVHVDYDGLMRAMDQQKVEVEPGDILCLYTGYADRLLAGGAAVGVKELESSFADIDGHDPRTLQWVTDSGVVAICADNRSVEAPPDRARHTGGGPFMPLHHHCLFKLGVFLAEFWYFGALAEWLARHNRNRFLLTAPPLWLPGAVGSPVTPVATV